MAPGCFSHSNKEASSAEKSPEPVMATKLDFIEISPTLNSIIDLDSKSKETVNACYYENAAFDCYAGEINLDQIPLPSTPYPDEEEDSDDSEEEEEDQEETSSNTEGKTDLLLKLKPRLTISSVRSPKKFSSIDTADTFEILEQTIIKQKRLAKLKNTDLRRKVLLKRTFDLVLEIMDAENGFNDADEPEQPAPTHLVEQQAVEIELHPSTCMEDDENEIEQQEAEKSTLIQLVDLEMSSARVPRQVKRRSSGSDEDDEYDESDDEDDEYSDQQLNNYRVENNDDLNIYIDSCVELEKSGKMGRNVRRSNHQRKRVKLTI